MNDALERLATSINLNSAANHHLRLEFGYACVSRVSQNFEDDKAIAAFNTFGAYLKGSVSEDEFQALCHDILTIASQHTGSKSIDGTQHAAVSATYALARAINGKAIEAAAYAAYSQLYGYGVYAIADPENFDQEHQAQVKLLENLLSARAV